MAAWQELEELLDSTHLGEGSDKIGWSLELSSIFLVNSMYAKLSQGASAAHFKDILAAKLIFTWQLAQLRLTVSLLARNFGETRALDRKVCALWGGKGCLTFIL
jgi:hypothetical protein